VGVCQKKPLIRKEGYLTIGGEGGRETEIKRGKGASTLGTQKKKTDHGGGKEVLYHKQVKKGNVYKRGIVTLVTWGGGIFGTEKGPAFQEGVVRQMLAVRRNISCRVN